MANVNDGSVVWSLNKINNAEQLNGLTAEQIKNNAINGKTVKLQGKSGSLTITYSNGNQPTATIPLPSGFTRSQCSYVITEGKEEKVYSDNNITIQTLMTHVNQSNGVITPYVANGYKNYPSVSLTVRYVITSAK